MWPSRESAAACAVPLAASAAAFSCVSVSPAIPRKMHRRSAGPPARSISSDSRLATKPNRCRSATRAGGTAAGFDEGRDRAAFSAALTCASRRPASACTGRDHAGRRDAPVAGHAHGSRRPRVRRSGRGRSDGRAVCRRLRPDHHPRAPGRGQDRRRRCSVRAADKSFASLRTRLQAFPHDAAGSDRPDGRI